jgi:hypothetical protein
VSSAHRPLQAAHHQPPRAGYLARLHHLPRLHRLTQLHRPAGLLHQLDQAGPLECPLTAAGPVGCSR